MLCLITSKLIIGSLVGVIAIAVSISGAYATFPVGYLDIESANSDGVTHMMTLADDVKQITAKKSEDIVTFWAWAVPNPTEAPEGTFLTVDAITIHHGVNDHQAFGKAAKSSPVQSFHPHRAYFDSNLCVIGLESPKTGFKVNQNTVTLSSSDVAVAAATGTIGPVDGCPVGLGVTNIQELVTIP